MKNILNTFFIITFMLLTTLTVYPQSDSLICGKEYKLRSVDGWEGKVILITYDSLTLTVRLEHKVQRISKDEVKEIVRSNKNFKETESYNERIHEECFLILKGGNKIEGVKMKKLSNDTLIVKRGKENIPVPIDNIKLIVFPNESNWGLYAVGGALGSGLVSLLIFELSRPPVDNNVLFGDLGNIGYNIAELYTTIGVTVAGGIITGIIAASAGSDDEFDLSTLNKEQKINEIKNIMEDTE